MSNDLDALLAELFVEIDEHVVPLAGAADDDPAPPRRLRLLRRALAVHRPGR